MAYRNENSFLRTGNATATVTSAGAATNDADRSVSERICFYVPVESDLFFFKLLDKRAIQELIKEVDPLMQVDEEVEEV